MEGIKRRGLFAEIVQSSFRRLKWHKALPASQLYYLIYSLNITAIKLTSFFSFSLASDHRKIPP